VLALALILPLAIMLVMLAQLSGLTVHMPSSDVAYADNTAALVAPHPAPSAPQPPPTLAPPPPTPTPLPATPTAVPPPMPRTYTVKPGDELKQIAADYNVSIWSIINSNTIPNPDSLRVGQTLTIPPK
jgi:LysM repeat protein